MDSKFMFVLVGLPRSGKTTWVEKSASEEHVVVSGDELRKLVYGQRFWAEGEPLMWSIRDVILRMLLNQGKIIIIDECNVTRKRRKPLIEMGKAHGYKVVAVNVPTSKEVCLERARALNDDVIPPVIERMAREFEPIDKDEGFFDVATVNEDNNMRSEMLDMLKQTRKEIEETGTINEEALALIGRVMAEF